MRKWLVYLLGGALILALPGLVAAQADFTAHLTSTPNQGADVFVRYYTPAKAPFNAGTGNCADLVEGVYCRRPHRGVNNGYRGHADFVPNYGAGDTDMFHAIWDTEKNGGTANHTGYFAWVCKVPVAGESHTWFVDGCEGPNTANISCLGTNYPGVAHDVANTPQGTILRDGGFSAVPVPTVADNNADGTAVDGTAIDLDWDDIQAVGCGANASYDLYYYIDDLSDGACNMPTDAQFTFLGNFADSMATVDTAADLGGDSFGEGEAKGIVFATKVVYPKTVGDQAETRYFSANGQCVSLDTALAAEVYDLVVRHAGRTNVEVSWKTSLEDGVRGFYVTRATSEAGPYTRVSDLVAANGEPSAYSFIDTITAPRGRVHVSGLFYQIEALDIDDNVQSFGPAALELPTSVRPRGVRPAPIRRR